MHDAVEEALCLQVRPEGLALSTPVWSAESNFRTAKEATTHLTRTLRGLEQWDANEHSQIFSTTASTCKRDRRKDQEKRADALLSRDSGLPEAMKKCMKRARDHTSANQWLFVTPCVMSKTVLTPHQFRDAINIRYGYDPIGLPVICECGNNKRNTLEHSLTCKSGGGVVGRHDIIKDELAFLAGEALSHSSFHVEKEVTLLGNRLPPPQGVRNGQEGGGVGGQHQIARDRGGGRRREEQQRDEGGGLRIDVRIRGLEESAAVTDVDVRCLYPDAHSYGTTAIDKLLENDEKEKCNRYQQAVQMEGHRFRPFVVSTDGVFGPAAKQLLKKISDKLAEKWKKPVGTVGGWIRARMGLAVVRACSACIRGSKVPGGARARRVEPEAFFDDTDGAFLGLQFSNGPAGQGRRVE